MRPFRFRMSAVKASATSKNKKHETKRFSTSAAYRLRHSETKKCSTFRESNCLIRETCFQRNMCERANQ